MGVGNA